MSDFLLGFITAYLASGVLMFACAARDEGWPESLNQWIAATYVVFMWPEAFIKGEEGL